MHGLLNCTMEKSRYHMARLTARQRNHSNVLANNVQEYFKRAYFLSFIDSVLYRSTRRSFHSSKSCCLPAKCVLPAFLNSSKYDDIGPAAAKLHRQFLPDGGLVALKTHAVHAVAADSSTGTGRDKIYTVKRPDCARNTSSRNRT